MLMADMRHMSSAKATDMAAAKTAAKATDVTSTEAATHVTATEAAAHVSAAEAAAHVTATKAATHMAATAATTAAACLCTGGEKAAGHYSGCQDLHYSSSHETLSHETLLCDGRGFRHGPGQALACPSWVTTSVTIGQRWECLRVVSIKFFIQPLKFERRTRFDRANARIKWRPLNSFLVERSVSGSNIYATAAL